ncbi:MAG: carboxymuconolactone decarboxylase [Rhodothermaceae bacterium]|nr:carboxymuconolactone decarboxylase [Rhodothermaceae bacterium]
MPHIPLPQGAPGIVGPMLAHPRTGRHIAGLAEAVLRGPSSLTRVERELIATYVSCGNDCTFCTNLHAEVARHLMGEDRDRLADVLLAVQQRSLESVEIDAKLRALLTIAEKVRENGHLVAEDDIAQAREAGADDQAIHDTVLIAALFSMINRYVDGLAAVTPTDPAVYAQAGAALANGGFTERIRWDASDDA